MKVIKWIVIILVVLGVVGYLGRGFLKSQTKKHSPEETITYESGDLSLSVFYCRPYKKGRKIFGELVPLNEVWRTGANEPTTFTTNKTVLFGGVFVEPGTYSLWTIPQQTQWTVILNSETPSWGANFSGKASHNAEFDVYKINVPTRPLSEEVEQFKMEFFGDVNLSMAWDKTSIIVPIQF